jgi:hypothetical protein
MIKEHIKLFTGSGIIVNGLQFLLDAEKVNYIIKDKYESARLGGFGENTDSVEVHVLNSDIEKAKEIIKDYQDKINL